MKNKATKTITLRVQPDMFERIQKLAANNHRNVSEQVRAFIDKGLEIDGYSQDVNLIAKVIRQELTAIYDVDDIKKIVDKQSDRLAKLQIKMGKMSASNYYLLAELTRMLWNNAEYEQIEELINDTSAYGVDYVSTTGGTTDRYLYDTRRIMEEESGSDCIE